MKKIPTVLLLFIMTILCTVCAFSCGSETAEQKHQKEQMEQADRSKAYQVARNLLTGFILEGLSDGIADGKENGEEINHEDYGYGDFEYDYEIKDGEYSKFTVVYNGYRVIYDGNSWDATKIAEGE